MLVHVRSKRSNDHNYFDQLIIRISAFQCGHWMTVSFALTQALPRSKKTFVYGDNCLNVGLKLMVQVDL